MLGLGHFASGAPMGADRRDTPACGGTVAPVAMFGSGSGQPTQRITDVTVWEQHYHHVGLGWIYDDSIARVLKSAFPPAQAPPRLAHTPHGPGIARHGPHLEPLE